ncbi:MAG: hypothetical protein CMP49_03905 [Flavobacteriales bacterium]|jgi:phosphopantetheine adenylyltransferase|nr:hypothetical protein [Flavobacteriales bacterium]|tara:strand:+ start:11791 stop:12003 length:213 start_codon:yes stop_codon:yes gene_type:complete
MDQILNDILVSKEKDTLIEYEKTLHKSLDYMESIENVDEEKIEKLRSFISRIINEEIDYLVRNPEDYFEL